MEERKLQIKPWMILTLIIAVTFIVSTVLLIRRCEAVDNGIGSAGVVLAWFGELLTMIPAEIVIYRGVRYFASSKQKRVWKTAVAITVMVLATLLIVGMLFAEIIVLSLLLELFRPLIRLLI